MKEKLKWMIIDSDGNLISFDNPEEVINFEYLDVKKAWRFKSKSFLNSLICNIFYENKRIKKENKK